MPLQRRTRQTRATRIVGVFDSIEGRVASGWLHDSRNPNSRLDVRLIMGEVEIARTRADVFRQDLKDAGIGDGAHGFSVGLPPDLEPARWADLRVSSADNLDLRLCPVRVETPASVRGDVRLKGGKSGRPEIDGWLLDMDDPSRQLVAHLVADGVVIARQPVAQATPEFAGKEVSGTKGQHGFNFRLPTSLANAECLSLRCKDEPDFELPVISRGTLRGAFDGISGSMAYGWAANAQSPAQKVWVSIIHDGKTVAESETGYARPDLNHLGEGYSQAGFAIRIPPQVLVAGGVVRAEVRPLKCVPIKTQLVGEAIVPPPTFGSGGVIERVDSGLVVGRIRLSPEKGSVVRIVIDGGVHQALIDVAVVGWKISAGEYRFTHPIPAQFLDNMPHCVTVFWGDGADDATGPHWFHGWSAGGNYLGHLDNFTAGEIRGWCIDPSRSDVRPVIRVDVGGKFAAFVRADEVRSDLGDLFGREDCGFSLPIPFHALNREKVVVRAEVAGTGRELPGSGRGFHPGPKDLAASRKKARRFSTMKPVRRSAAALDGNLVSSFFDDHASEMSGIASAQTDAVSIVMPTWNRAYSISRAIDSVVSQHYGNWELHIVDDGSDDDTATIVEPYLSDRRIKFHRIQKCGVSAARNVGMNAANGSFVAYLDSDNAWRPLFLTAMLAFMRKGRFDAAYCASKSSKNGDCYYRATEFDWEALLQGNYIDLNVFVHRRSLLTECGLFDESLRRMVDWDLILRYTKNSRTGYANFVGVDYNDDSNDDRITCAESSSFQYRIIEKHLLDWPAIAKRSTVAGFVSIVIPVYGQPEMTERCVLSVIESLRESTAYEIIVVDNGSDRLTYDRLDALSDKYVHVRVCHNFKNLNFALGCNIGAREAIGEYLVFLNNDTIVTNGWLEPLIRPLNDQVGMVQPKLLYPDGTVQCAGAAFNRFSPIPYHIYQGWPGHAAEVNSSRDLSAITGACFSIAARDFCALQGFDTIFVNGCEDTDLCLRMRQDLEKNCRYEPESVVYHDESKTPGRGRHIRQNRLEFASRWKGNTPIDDEAILAKDGLAPGTLQAEGGQLMKDGVAIIRANRPMDKAWLNAPSIRLLIVKPSGVGNMVMFTPAFSALREAYPHAHITVACYPADAQIIAPEADAIVKLGKDPVTGACKTEELDRLVTQEHFDVAVYPPFTNVARPTKVMRERIAYHITHPRIDYLARHEVEHNFDVVRLLGVEGNPGAMTVPVAAVDGIPKKPFVTMHPGSSASVHMLKKRWPLRHWSNLIDILVEDRQVVIVGGPDEGDDIDEIMSNVSPSSRKSITVMAGENAPTLAECGGIFARSSSVISNDSGMMHIAAALDVPLLAIFGPTSIAKNGPWMSQERYCVLRADVPCDPCYVAGPDRLLRCATQICLSELRPETIAEALDSLMTRIAEN